MVNSSDATVWGNVGDQAVGVEGDKCMYTDEMRFFLHVLRSCGMTELLHVKLSLARRIQLSHFFSYCYILTNNSNVT